MIDSLLVVSGAVVVFVAVGVALVLWLFPRGKRAAKPPMKTTLEPPSAFPPPPAPPPRSEPLKPDKLMINGLEIEALEGTVLAFGPPWVIRAKLRLGAGQQQLVEELVREKRIVKAGLCRAGCDAVLGEAKAARVSLFRDKQGVACASLELIGIGKLEHL
jgi:hypothetical protein